MGGVRRRVQRGAAAATACAVVGGGLLIAVLASGSQHRQTPESLRLSLLAGESERAVSGASAAKAPLKNDYRRGIRTTVARARTASLPTFGQPTIAGIGGWGFEADLRLDPSNANQLYMSAPDSANSNTSFIWRSLDGGRTFKWVPAAAPLGGKPTPECAGGGDSELAVDPAGRLYFNDLTLANFSVARSDDFGRTFQCSNSGVPDTAVDRQWYALDGDPTAGGSLYLTNDEVGNGAPQCGSTTLNNTLVMYRSPFGGAGATAGLLFGPPNHITVPGSCDEGIMGNNEVSPVATKTGQIVDGQPTTLASPVRHVYVIHDDGTLSKIRIGRCFPVAFGPAIPNVSDPSGLNCVDLPVANLGEPDTVRTGGNFPTLAIDKAGNLYAVWEQAPYNAATSKAGDSSLMYSYSTDEGNHWSAPIQIPTPGLANNVFAWAAAGDDGRVDIAWYGTPALVDLENVGPDGCPNGGPDNAYGSWSVYFTQTLNGHSSAVSFSAPVVAGEHPVRHGSIQTIIGNQCGGSSNTSGANRTLGDFFQLRIGSKGEAQISYANSTSLLNALLGTHAMYVRQIGGTGVYANQQPKGDAILNDAATDPAKDATYEAAGATSANMPNLDILSSKVSWPNSKSCHPAKTACLRVTMTIANLSTAAPASPDSDTDLVWLTQWLLPAAPGCTSPAASCTNGGANFMVYGESTAENSPIQCWAGQSSMTQGNGALGLVIAYPPTTQITEPDACKVVPGANGTITIDVPLSQVSLDPGVAPFSSKLYSVTASTMTLPQPANAVISGGGIGGVPFNLIDVVRAYDARR
jgi:hypothetical protein